MLWRNILALLLTGLSLVGAQTTTPEPQSSSDDSAGGGGVSSSVTTVAGGASSVTAVAGGGGVSSSVTAVAVGDASSATTTVTSTSTNTAVSGDASATAVASEQVQKVSTVDTSNTKLALPLPNNATSATLMANTGWVNCVKVGLANTIEYTLVGGALAKPSWTDITITSIELGVRRARQLVEERQNLKVGYTINKANLGGAVDSNVAVAIKSATDFSSAYVGAFGSSIYGASGMVVGGDFGDSTSIGAALVTRFVGAVPSVNEYMLTGTFSLTFYASESDCLTGASAVADDTTSKNIVATPIGSAVDNCKSYISVTSPKALHVVQCAKSTDIFGYSNLGSSVCASSFVDTGIIEGKCLLSGSPGSRYFKVVCEPAAAATSSAVGRGVFGVLVGLFGIMAVV